MSEHTPGGTDRSAAFRGLILGAIVLGLVIVTIIRLTNARYSGTGAGGSAASTWSARGATVVLDV